MQEIQTIFSEDEKGRWVHMPILEDEQSWKCSELSPLTITKRHAKNWESLLNHFVKQKVTGKFWVFGFNGERALNIQFELVAEVKIAKVVEIE